MQDLERFTAQPRVAYFSMEIALRAEIPTYSGGLGVLAGDVVHSAADLGLPLVALTLACRAGYFRQELDAAGHQIEHPQRWDPQTFAARLPAAVALDLDGRSVWTSAWLYTVRGLAGDFAPVILLDTDLPINDPADRTLTSELYGGDASYRLKQEAILGLGGVRMLQALGFRVRKYHLNEGHSALIALELLRRFRRPAGDAPNGEPAFDVGLARELCIFTTHTPVEAAQDRFAWDLVSRVLQPDAEELTALRSLAGVDALNMTRLALNTSAYVNGVAERHAEVSRRLFPGHRVHAITNGVHTRWAAPSIAALYDRHLPHWRIEPQLLMRADRVPGDELWRAHLDEKRRLLERIAAASGTKFDVNQPLIGFARRMTEYKRPELLFADVARLREIARRHPFQVVLAGKAHPRDGGGKASIARLWRLANELGDAPRVVFLPDYDLTLAHELVAGCDLWLNTPLPPLEASGTSGMKAAFNGVPSLSVLDGWWIEGCIEGQTGWAVGEPGDTDPASHAEALYRKLDERVLPLYCDDRSGWIDVMRGAIAKNASYFNSHRMMRRYVTEAYFR